MRNMLSVNIIALIVYLGNSLFAQESERKYFERISLEYNTAVVIHNAKLSAEFGFYKNHFVDVSLQPGFEYIYSLGVENGIYNNSPYYDINMLGTSEFFYDSDFSLKPFLGFAYRINSNVTVSQSSIELKYGGALQVNIFKHFNLIAKAMYVSKQSDDDVPILFGLGFTILFY